MTRKKNPVSRLFGMLRRRQQKEVVTANQMKEAVKTKRAQRAIQ
jgi:hypothetical protein